MDDSQIERAEPILNGLANRRRLQLLVQLQQPKRLAEITLAPTRGDGWGAQGRRISRQAVRRHLSILEDLGVVTAAKEDGETAYVVNRPALFVLTEELRTLATVRPPPTGGDGTEALTRLPAIDRWDGPQLILVRGVEEGRSFPLVEPAREEGWVIGRSRQADISLDYDPYVSSAQARVFVRKGRVFLMDLETSRNTTMLNWEPMVPKGLAPLSNGDLIGVGMSLLMFHDGAVEP